MSPVRCCFDRLRQRELMRPQVVAAPRLGVPQPSRALGPRGKTWMNGSTLRVRFIGGTDADHALVRAQAGWWQEAANLRFEFCNAPGAEIRIAFEPSEGAWSYMGTDASDIPFSHPTMNLGFLERGIAAHEFGHAIGLAHEHRNPVAGIRWNEEAVIRAMAAAPNFWDEATTRHNILRKYAVDQIGGTEFDGDSIMRYFFPPEWTVGAAGSPGNEVLSALDKELVAGARMYPRGRPGVGDAVGLAVDGRRMEAKIGHPGEEDPYCFRAPSDGVYQVDTRGETDVHLKLYGPGSATALVAEDDDGGYGLNPRISTRLMAGVYYVQVRHYEAGGTGNYTIGVKQR
jgi:hypothetical protein